MWFRERNVRLIIYTFFHCYFFYSQRCKKTIFSKSQKFLVFPRITSESNLYILIRFLHYWKTECIVQYKNKITKIRMIASSWLSQYCKLRFLRILIQSCSQLLKVSSLLLCNWRNKYIPTNEFCITINKAHLRKLGKHLLRLIPLKCSMSFRILKIKVFILSLHPGLRQNKTLPFERNSRCSTR